MNNQRLRHLFLLALLLFTARLGWSQGATTAAMSGVITDAKGEGLPGATVIAIHTPTNTQYVAPTNSDGRFNIQNMRVGGPYTVRVTFVGFKDVNKEGLNLNLGQNLRFDQKLSDASTELSEVTVTSRRDPVINAGRTGASTTVQREQIERLPSLSRSFADFTRLTPQASSGNNQSFAGRSGNYNNVTIDGAIFNNSFGLSSTVGGQSNAQPISLDAVQEIQVNLAPFDVRQGSFTGAGINAITRSGTNTVSASVYGFQRSEKLVGSKVRDLNQDFPNFSLYQLGARVGGPILKDKLFYFVSVEGERRQDPPGTFVANRLGLPSPGIGSNTSRVNASDLDVLSGFVKSKYGYDVGGYEGLQLAQNSDKITAKLDWNINSKNSFSIKYNYLKAYRDVTPSSSGTPSPAGGRGLSQNSVPLFSSYYRIHNDVQSVIGELNSSINSKISNQFQAGYTANRDYRESLGGNPFPFVDILNTDATSNAGTALTTFGFEQFTPGNLLDSDTYQLSDNLTYSSGNHLFTVGTYNEFYKFRNGFAPDLYGRYRFNSLDDFYNAAGYVLQSDRTTILPRNADGSSNTNLSAVGVPLASATNNYSSRYILNINGQNPSGELPYATTKAMQLGFFVQDEWTARPNVKVTAGLRMDLPIIFSSLLRNEDAAAIEFRNKEHIYTDQLPKVTPLFSPRIGVNWDVNDDQKTQLRGGTGIFTGRVPFVLISNQASNNGLLFGTQSVNGFVRLPGATVDTPNPNAVPFNPTTLNNPPANITNYPATYNLAVVANDFKFPQVWRTNVAVDQRLPGDVVLTLEGIFTKDLNAVFYDNVNLPDALTNSKGADQRPLYRPANALNTKAFQVSPKIVSNDGAIVLRNSNKGYSYTITGQVQKSFSNGLAASAAYTYADARDVSIQGSTPFPLWASRAIVGDPNAQNLSYSQFLQSHRVVASLSYRKEYLGHLATTLSAFLDAGPNGRYSYVYNGDMNGDNSNSNDLMYIPRDRSEIVLNNTTLFQVNNANTPQSVLYTADQQWIDLDNYINQDSYLSKRRGEYAERNGAVNPWFTFVDARLLQDVFTNIGKNRNSLQLSVDVFNIGNLLNSNWGVSQSVQRASPLTFNNFDQTTGKPTFTFSPITSTRTVNLDRSVNTNVQTLNVTDRYNTGETSRYRIQLGLRYTFN